MPTYDFLCEGCGNKYEALTSYDESGQYKEVACPVCSSDKKQKLVSIPQEAIFAQPKGTSKWMKSHSFRYYKKLEEDKKLRKQAEEQSHVGANPYNKIDDISSGKNFGPVQ